MNSYEKELHDLLNESNEESSVLEEHNLEAILNENENV